MYLKRCYDCKFQAKCFWPQNNKNNNNKLNRRKLWEGCDMFIKMYFMGVHIPLGPSSYRH